MARFNYLDVFAQPLVLPPQRRELALVGRGQSTITGAGIAFGRLKPLPHRGLGQIEVLRDLTDRPVTTLTQLHDLSLVLRTERTTKPWLLLTHGLHDEHPSGTKAPDLGCPSKRVKVTFMINTGAMPA